MKNVDMNRQETKEKPLDLKSLTLPMLEKALGEMGEPKYRAGQIFTWIHARQAGSFAEMSDLPLLLRERLKNNCHLTVLMVKLMLESKLDGTRKYLFALEDGNCIEAVRMKYAHGDSLCISTQVGCRMGCGFCASTVGGLVRNLTAGEMLEQFYRAEADQGAIDSVVLMGIGEPLDNFDNVLDFISILTHPKGRNLGARHISLSTCGLCDKIDALAERKLGLTLSVSLHAVDDATRQRMMPVAKQWPLAELMSTCRRYFETTGRRVSYEYAIIDGINDSPDAAEALGALLKGQICHVNLIPLNDARRGYRRGKRENVERFASILTARGITATIRRELGSDIAAACGQLRRQQAAQEAGEPDSVDK